MAETKKTAGGTRKPAKKAGGISAAEKRRRQRQAAGTTGEAGSSAYLPTGESADEVRAAIEEARRAQEAGRTLGEAEAGGATVTTAAQLRARAQGELIRLPSTLVARVRRPGMIAMLQAGVIPNALMPMVEKGLEAGSKGQTVTEAEIIGELKPEMLEDLMQLFDLVAMFLVIEPRLRPVPEKCDACGSIKDLDLKEFPENHKHEWRQMPEPDWPVTHPLTGEELAYVSWVDTEDKQFLWNYASGGSRDVDRFRADQQTSTMEPL